MLVTGALQPRQELCRPYRACHTNHEERFKDGERLSHMSGIYFGTVPKDESLRRDSPKPAVHRNDLARNETGGG
jgi:hypothetical protein